MARDDFKQAGVESLVSVIEGDAHAHLSKLKPAVDVTFIDADKGG